MVKFLFKKFFYTFLDHFFQFLVLNAGFLLCLIISLGISSLVLLVLPGTGFYLMLIMIFLTVFLLTLYMGAAAGIMHAIADNQAVSLKDFFYYLKTSFKNSLLFALIHCLLLFLFISAMAFYTGMEWVFGFFANAFLFWTGMLWLVASQYFFAIHYRMEKGFLKILKKMFIVFFDNQLFSIGLFMAAILLGMVSVPTLFMIPGFISLQLLINLGLKFRFYKYAYLEKAAAAQAHQAGLLKKIPWVVLLEADIKLMGNRTIRNTFFPGKQQNI